MNQSLAVILPMLFFVILDFVIVLKVYKFKYSSSTRNIFLFMTVSAFVQQLCGTISYLFDYQIVPAPAAAQYIVYLFLFTAMALTSFEWFMYLRMLLAGKSDLPNSKKILFALPIGIIFWMTAFSPLTRWILWVDADGVYQRGTLYFMQFVCCYIYVIFAIVALIFYRKQSKSVYWKKVNNNFIIFILPAVLGSILQLKVFQGGYTMIGISLAILFLYLDLYVDEVNENQILQITAQEQKQHLKEVTELNRSLEESAAEKEAQLEEISTLNDTLFKEQKLKEREQNIIAALSASYLNTYVINTVEQTVEILKLNGYVTMGMTREKTGPYPYEATCRTYIKNRVYDEDQQMVTDCMSLDNILSQLKTRGEYEFTYRVPENGGISYYQGKYVAIDEDYLVCGFQNIDEIVKKEILKRKELKEAKDAAEKRSKELNDQLNIIGGLTNACIVCTYYDLKANEVFQVKGIPEIQDLLKECTTSEKAFSKFISIGVASEDIPAMKEFVCLDTLTERLNDRDVISIEFRKLFPKQGWNRASWIVAARDEAGNAYKMLYIVEEITDSILERKQHEADLKQARDEAEAANKAKTSFLFNMSHDIRTPMNAIIGFTELLKKYKNDENKVDDYIGKIQSSSNFLLSLINNVLEMARIESGKTTLDETVFMAGEICGEIVSVYADQMQKKNITFTHSVDCHTKYIYGDTVKLREIWLNIVSNAYKYTPEGGAVSISTIELPSDKEGYARFQTTFADTGIGMSKEYLDVIFEEFSRERTSTESQIQGTGLGMPIVKKLVDLMGGTITVESELGKGSTFTVTLIHRVGTAPSSMESDNQEIMDFEEFKGKRILLAEDNDLNAEIAEEILSEAGFKVERAADGVICVDMLQKTESGYYDLILMDIQMPNMNGYQATKVIRSMDDSKRRQIPIIAMTANAFDEDKRNAIDAGMDGHVAKPIEISVLMKTIAAVLKDQ